MHASDVKWFALAMAFAWIGCAQPTYADEGVTARNKALVHNFYTTVFIDRDVDAAPRFLRTDYIAQPERADGIEWLHGYLSRAVCSETPIGLQTRASKRDR